MGYMYNEENIKNRKKIFKSSDSTSLINDIFFKTIYSVLKENDKLLDLGTGNGYVLSKIKKEYPYQVSLYGNDNSVFMVQEANSQSIDGCSFVLCSNYNLSFPDNFFDIVVAKNVTRFSSKEIFRVLKPGGYFVFREYGKWKGLKEVSDLFKGRLIRSRSKSFYDSKMKKYNFVCIKSDYVYFERIFPNVDTIIDCVKSYPFIDDFSLQDINKIRERFPGENITIHTDGIILFYRKGVNYEC